MAFDPLQKVSGRALRILITLASSCGFILFGYDNGVFSGLLVSPWFLSTFHKPNPTWLGTVSAMYNIGGTAGSIFAFFCGETLGRRRTVLAGVLVCAVGAVVQCVSVDRGELVAGRIVCGVGVGAMSSTVGIWQAETVPSRSRGRYLTFQLLGGAATGLFFAQWINYGFHNSKSRVAFVFPVAFQLVFVVTAGCLIIFLPESPRWLVKKDKYEQATVVLTRLHPTGNVPELLAEIVEGCALERRTRGNQYAVLLAGGPTQNFRRLALACWTMIAHQLNGINSITYYMPTLLIKFIGASHKTALWVSGMTSITSIICAVVPVATIDRVGRRPFLWGGAYFQCAMFIIIAALLATTPGPAGGHGPGHTYGVAIVVMFFLYYGVNAATWLGPSWAYPAEILPLQIREKGLALGNVCYWLFQFMIVEITPMAVTNIGYKFYVILAVLNFCDATIVYFLYPETKGLSLEEIDFYFARKYGGEEGRAAVSEIHGLDKVGTRPKERKNDVEHVEDKAA